MNGVSYGTGSQDDPWILKNSVAYIGLSSLEG